MTRINGTRNGSLNGTGQGIHGLILPPRLGSLWAASPAARYNHQATTSQGDQMKTAILAALLCAGVTTATQVAAQYGPYGYSQGPAPRAMPYAMPGRPDMPTADADSPDQQLRDGVNKLLGFMRREQEPSSEEMTSFLDQEIAPFFDFGYMAKVAAGRMYGALGEERQAELAAHLKTQFLGTLAERLGAFDDQDVKFLASRVNPDGRTGSASLAILNPQSYPARIDFRFYRLDGQWLVYDVVANGQSAVAHYRREFRQMMRGGPARPQPMPGYRMPSPPMMGGYR
jgi:phospholipid transport system substrate-binding protein